jgi:hypothetical protein
VEDNKVVATTETVEEESKEEVKETKVEKTYSRDEVNKIIAAENSKLLQSIEAKKNEAEKLAKMKEEERLQYERDKVQGELNELKIQLNAKNLKDEATKIASEKGLPISYLELVDFTKETAESIDGKIQTLVDARSKDLETALNSKLKQTSPFQKKDDGMKSDLYEQAFKKGWN